MDEIVNVTPSILTEEMIDAAMSKSLQDKSKELEKNSPEKINNDHNYFDDDTSSSDYDIESIDGSSVESLDNTSKNKIDQCKIVIQNGDTNEKDGNNSQTLCTLNNELNVKETLGLEAVNQKPETNVKKGLIIKPLSNLLKTELISQKKVIATKDVKVFKYVNGKIELIPDSAITPAEKRKFLMYKNKYQSTTISNTGSIHLDKLLCDELLKSRKNSTSEESLSESLNNDQNDGLSDYQNCFEGENKSSNSIQAKNDVALSTYGSLKNNCIQNTEKAFRPSNSLLKPISKLNVHESKVVRSSTGFTDVMNKSVPVIDITADNETEKECDEEITIENICNDRLSVITTKKLNSSLNNNVSRNNSMEQLHGKNPMFYRRHILPKINYRYHTKDNSTSDKSCNNSAATIISVNNTSNTKTKPSVYKLATDNSNGKSLVVVAPENLKNQQKLVPQSVIQLTPTSIAAKPKYVRNVINSVIGAVNSVTTANHISTTSTSSKTSLVKDKTCAPSTTNSKKSENWEKLDRVSLISERHKSDSGLDALTNQIMERDVPVYRPIGTKEVYPCLECGDRFALEESLKLHKLRKSVLIIYWCRTCSRSLNLFNKCMFLSHIRSHNQLFKNLDLSCLNIEPLPKSLLRLGSDEEPEHVADKPSSSVTINVPVCDSTVTLSSPVLISIPPASSATAYESDSLSTSIASNGTNTSVTGISTVENPRIIRSDICSNSSDSAKQNVEVLNDLSCVPQDDVIFDEVATFNIVSNVDKSKEVSSSGITEINISEGPPESTVQQQSGSVEKNPRVKPSSEMRIMNANKQVKGRRVCPECGISITPKCSLKKHLQNFNRPLTDTLRCDICQLILQSVCALKMHSRIHTKIKPYRCPECAIEFSLFDRFIMHLKYTCCHMAKVVRYICSLCSSMHTSAAILEQHVLLRHAKAIYKCGSCPVGFTSAKGAEKHREKEHPKTTLPALCFQQCNLCPEKLIPKDAFLPHMRNHLNDDKVRIYAYSCPSCSYTFFHRTELIYHRMKCDSRAGIIQSVLEDAEDLGGQTVDKGNSGKTIGTGGNEVEFISPSKKRKMSNDDDLEQIPEDEKDPLSLEDFQAEQPLQEPRLETCVVCKTEKVLILPGGNQSSQSMCCTKCVSPCGVPPKPDQLQRTKLLAAKLKDYKCKICKHSNYMDLKSIFIHFKYFHKELEGQSINKFLIIENTPINFKKSNTRTTAETIKEKYKKKRTSTVLNSSVQVLQGKGESEFDTSDRIEDVGVPEKKKPKKSMKQKQKVCSSKNSFESGQLIVVEETEKAQFSCSKCDFVGADKEKLHEHIVSHRSDPNALQCLECGECFVVLPSLEKHLIISHRITDVDKYISDNKQCMPALPIDEELLSDAKDDGKGFSNKCRVCHEMFESKFALDKHFRSHGMAFLFKGNGVK